ncbi:hypothetical protein F511_45166 [Dorcoceras hygrometricum]|uniref:ROK family protein n=1 Tax=Dorcoceras hygrometricum TaxID=472368 RepID=A0A2Z7A4G1_9LAMI|nr:hypothetical protein F511_45166 [Dorcoceras hygrometricum]
MKKANTNLVKEINLNIVRQVMKRVEMATKPQLAALTKLSVVTVNSLVKELHERGELFEDETVPSNGGRPALTYRYNYDFSQALVIHMKEIQGSELLISAAVINLEDRTLEKEEYVMPVFHVQPFYDNINRLLDSFPSIKRIGIGIPGQMADGEIRVSSHRELTGLRLVEDLEQQFGLPVTVENDINAAISGYCAKLEPELKESYCVAGIYFPNQYPPGMGIYLDGKMIKGKHGMAGEIKFLPSAPDWYQEIAAETFLECAFQIIQTVNAVLAPDKFVIYQNMTCADRWFPAWESYQLAHPMPTLPEIILQDTFQQDFEAGMRWLTLKELEPALISN